MQQPPNTKKVILTAEGPNGEDIVEYRDIKTGVPRGRALVLVDNEGSEVFRPMSAPPKETGEPAEQPSGGSSSGPAQVPTAQDLAKIAEQRLVEKTEVEGRKLFSEIGLACAEAPEAGSYTHLVKHDSGITGKAITAAIKELRAYGYTVKKVANPAKGGVEIQVKWPTTTKTKPKKKRGRPKKSPSNSPQEQPLKSEKSLSKKKSPSKPKSESK